MSHPSDPKNFTDLSGLPTPVSSDSNPYNALIDACNDDPVSQPFWCHLPSCPSSLFLHLQFRCPPFHLLPAPSPSPFPNSTIKPPLTIPSPRSQLATQPTAPSGTINSGPNFSPPTSAASTPTPSSPLFCPPKSRPKDTKTHATA